MIAKYYQLVIMCSIMCSFIFKVKSEIELKRELNLPVDWPWDDWVEKPTTDQLGQDSAAVHRKAVHFETKGKMGLFFSVYSPKNLVVHQITPNHTSKRFPVKQEKSNTNQWQHYGILFDNKNNKTFIMEENRILINYSFISENIDLVTAELTYWKIHDYILRSSDKITKDMPSELIIPPSTTCLQICTALSNYNYLKILISSVKENETMIINSSMKSWQQHRLRIETDEETKLHIIEKSTDLGHWAIDVKLCDGKMGNNKIDIYTRNLLEKDFFQYSCQILDVDNFNETKTNRTASCPVGYIDRYCNTSCKSVLGPKYPQCEKHIICKKGVGCVCAWGFQGPFCNETCINNTWGLSCRNKCNSCDNCDIKTGKCRQSSVLVVSIIVSLTLIIIIIVIARCNYQIFTRNRTSVICNEVSHIRTLMIPPNEESSMMENHE